MSGPLKPNGVGAAGDTPIGPGQSEAPLPKGSVDDSTEHQFEDFLDELDQEHDIPAPEPLPGQGSGEPGTKSLKVPLGETARQSTEASNSVTSSEPVADESLSSTVEDRPDTEAADGRTATNEPSASAGTARNSIPLTGGAQEGQGAVQAADTPKPSEGGPGYSQTTPKAASTQDPSSPAASAQTASAQPQVSGAPGSDAGAEVNAAESGPSSALADEPSETPMGGGLSHQDASPAETRPPAAALTVPAAGSVAPGAEPQGTSAQPPSQGEQPGTLPETDLAGSSCDNAADDPVSEGWVSDSDPQSDALDDEAAVVASVVAGQGLGAPTTLVDQGIGPAGKPTAPPEASDAAERAEAAEVISRLSERLLVSHPTGVGEEIRIRLKPDTLDGAEIYVRHDANGTTILFEAGSADVARQIDEFADELTQHMQDVTGEPVHVETVVTGDGDQTSDNGRSQNSLDPWDIYDEDDR